MLQNVPSSFTKYLFVCHNFSFVTCEKQETGISLEMRHGASRLQRVLRLNKPVFQPASQYVHEGHPRPHAHTHTHSAQRWSSSASSKPVDGNQEVPTPQPPEAKTAASPTLPVRRWSTPLAKTIAQAIEVRVLVRMTCSPSPPTTPKW